MVGFHAPKHKKANWTKLKWSYPGDKIHTFKMTLFAKTGQSIIASYLNRFPIKRDVFYVESFQAHLKNVTQKT